MRNMKYQEYVKLAPYTSFKLGGQARYFCALSNPREVSAVFDLADKLNISPFFLGGGSNTIFADGVIDKLVVKNNLHGVSFDQSGKTVLATVAAGENWDEFVAQTVVHGFTGVEALSGIPGTVGAGPVQNIGAYGAELADVLVSVIAWDSQIEEWREFDREECDFSYRNSRFKREPGRFFITEVKLQLSIDSPRVAPEYASLKAYLEKNRISDPNLTQIREAVIAVRATRLPDVERQPNAGSFFTNPIIGKDQADELQHEFPDVVRFDLEDSQTKIPAGWLIERAGLKARQFGNFRTSADNALVLIHDGEGTTAELLEVEERIKRKVRDMFGITLEREPNLMT